MSDEPNRLSRWSQRKLAARRGEVPDEAPDLAVAGNGPAGDTAPERPGVVPVAADEAMPELPSIDELTADSDYTVFLRQGVPAALTRAALRKLWTSDPVLANLDGLNDYDEVYNAVQPALTLAQTSYRPGRGHLDETESEVEERDTVVADDTAGRTESEVDVASADGEDGGEDALGNDDTAGRTESEVDVASADGEDGGEDALGNSDAPASELADAARQTVRLDSDDATGEPGEEPDK